VKHGRKRIAALAALEAASLPWRGDPGHAITSLGFTLNHALNDPAGRLIASFGSVADWAVRIAQICGVVQLLGEHTDRRYGWFLEPSYTYSFTGGHEQSFGLSTGLLILIR
jgi:hypothetical protein